MLHLDRILLPTDGSECADRARAHALHLANHFDTTLHVIHVEEREANLSEVIDIREDDILSDLHVPLGEGGATVPEPRVQEQVVVHPSAAEGILTYATEHDIDLIVLGTHGRGGVRRVVLGSVAEEVVRRAQCPVLSVGRGAETPVEESFGHVLVPVDFSEHQTRLLDHVREAALVYDMKVTLLHVLEHLALPKVYGVSMRWPDEKELEGRVHEALEELAEPLQESGLDVDVRVRKGDPAEEILAATEELGTNIIAVATHGQGSLRRMLVGGVAERVIRRAECPVFTIKSFGKSLVDGEHVSSPSA